MKKFFALLLALALVLTLAACGGDEKSTETTAAPQAAQTQPPVAETTRPQEPQPAETEAAVEVSNVPYGITLEGVILVPGQPYDASALPNPSSVYQVPSCAIEGNDNVYSFPAFEVTAFDNGTEEIIYSIFLVDPNTATDEGLMLGDKVEKVLELYGENYTESGTAMVYTGADTMLRIIIQNGYVVDIEYRWITE